jgi:glycerophosphoryl diester phosphodiesterase
VKRALAKLVPGTSLCSSITPMHVLSRMGDNINKMMGKAALLMATAAALLAISGTALADDNSKRNSHKHRGAHKSGSVQLGPRPFFLVDDMSEGPLKRRLQQCAQRGAFTPREFSIGHRGAAMQFPEHTAESYTAAARMGAGIVECDVTFTKDKELVCRHAQNDLHTTTNILVTPLAAKCTQLFTPATFDSAGIRLTTASAECRTSDITLAEFKTLRGKMDASNASARTPAEYLGGTANWRTDLYSGPSSGTLVTHKESIELFKRLGVKMTPELKSPSVTMPFDGFTQEAYAQKMIDAYKAAGVPPRHVWPQSFDIRDVLYWVNNEVTFGKQAVYLDDAGTAADLPTHEQLVQYKSQGIQIVAPPIFALLAVDAGGRIVPSAYARNAKMAGLDIITWTLERSGILADGDNGFYYQTIDAAIKTEGDVMQVIDVLARDVGVLGIFSDWPATTTFYANCAGLR